MINLSETCDFSLETYGLNSVHNMFCPGRMGDSAGSKVTQQLMMAETSSVLGDWLFTIKQGHGFAVLLWLWLYHVVQINAHYCHNKSTAKLELCASFMA